MTTYCELISQFLQKQHPDHNSEFMVITSLNFKIIPFKAQSLLEKYTKLKLMVLTRCDLRNLQNFPRLPLLSELDLSHNSLQGTLNFLMPCSQLKYLDLSNNLISSHSKLQPLRRLAGIEVCVKDNPFAKQTSWKSKIKHYSIKIAKQPRKLIPTATPKQPKQEQVRPKRQENDFLLNNSPHLANANDIKRRMTTMRRMINEDHQRMEAQRQRQNPLEDSDSDEMLQFLVQDQSEIIEDVFLDEGNIDEGDDSDNEEKSEALALVMPNQGDQLFGFDALEQPQEQNQSSDSSS